MGYSDRIAASIKPAKPGIRPLAELCPELPSKAEVAKRRAAAKARMDEADRAPSRDERAGIGRS